MFSHLLLVALMVAALGAAVVEFRMIGREADDILKTNFSSVLAAGEVGASVRTVQTGLNLLEAGEPARASEAMDLGLQGLRRYVPILVRSADAGEEERLALEVQLANVSFQEEIELVRARNALSPQADLPRTIRDRLGPQAERLLVAAATLREANVAQLRSDNADLRRVARSALLRLGIVAGVATVLAVLLAIRLVRMALTPLAVIARRAERIGQGDFEGELTVPRKDEIGTLAESVNAMATRLAEVRRSEVRKLERAMRMSDAALDSLYDPVVVTDARSRVLFLNRAAEGLFGSAPVDHRPPIAEIVPDKRILTAIHAAAEHGTQTARDDDTALVTVRDRTYRLRATPMRDDDERLLGSVLVLEDVTHLRVIDRIKSEFIGVASHELRTPVTSLLLATQLLEEEALGPLTEAQRELVLAQKQDLDRLERLMRDLLDVTRLEAGSSPPRLEWTPPATLVAPIVATLRPQADEKGVGLTVHVAAELPMVEADPRMIGRVLTNLLANALRHTPAGGTVILRARHEGEGVTFEVEDNGEGIPKEYLDKIFRRFVQVPGATGGGAGLGLSIAQNIVRAHGDELSAESEPGKGSEFRFTLRGGVGAVEGEGAFERENPHH